MKITFILLLFLFANIINTNANSTEDNLPTESIDFSPKIKSVEIISMNVSKDFNDYYDIELKIHIERADSIIFLIEENNNPTLRKETILSSDSIQHVTLKNIYGKESARIEIKVENDFNTDSYELSIPVSSTPQAANIGSIYSNCDNVEVLVYDIYGFFLGRFNTLDKLNSIKNKFLILKTYSNGVLIKTKTVRI